MKDLKGTKTEANLMTAFAGESQARNKYTYYASKAKKEGYVGGAATAGKILGVIGIILSVVFFVLAVVVGVAIFSSPEVQQELSNVLNR